MKVTGNACSHTPPEIVLRPGVDSRCEACQQPMGVRMAWGKLRLWYEGSTKRFPGDHRIRVMA